MSDLDVMGQFLTFEVGGEIFALNIGSVREVIELTHVTRVPRTPKHMRGVLNLRGNAVPVVDMRLKLGMDSGEDTVDTCIIIVEVVENNSMVVIGALVDAVREVFDTPEGSIEEPPNMGLGVEANYIAGMGRQDDRFVIILDVERIFSSEELAVARKLVVDDELKVEA